MHAAILLNEKSGTSPQSGFAARAKQLRRQFSRHDVRVTILPFPGASAPKTLAQAEELDPDVLVAAGGDGTVNAVADHCIHHGRRMGVLAFGTLNHFARDAGIPPETTDAVRVIARGRTRRVDAADVNGHVFVNNSSIGLYPKIVHQREELRAPNGGGKWRATARAALSVLRRNPTLDVQIDTPEGVVHKRTPFVFVGNNPYDLRLFELGHRQRLDTGLLSLYFSHHPGRNASLRLGLRSIVGRLAQDKDFEAMQAPQFTLSSRRSTLQVAYDGEVRRLDTPLRYQSRPRALRLLTSTTRRGS